jgi:hypothetical protein
MSEMRRAVVKNADMSDEMQQDAVDVATAGLGKVCSLLSAFCFLLVPPVHCLAAFISGLCFITSPLSLLPPLSTKKNCDAAGMITVGLGKNTTNSCLLAYLSLLSAL